MNPDAELLSNVVTVQNYYDLLFPCAMENPDVGVRYITEQLLAQTAETWKILPKGDSCTDPFFHRNIWLWGVEYLDHRLMTEFGCQKLQPGEDDVCCTVVRMDLRFTASGLYYGPVLQDAMESFVSQEMDTRETSLTIPLHTASVEPPPEFYVPTPTASSAELPRDRITEPSAAAQIATTSSGKSSSFADHWFIDFFSNASLLQLAVVGTTALAVILASIAVLLARRQYHKKRRLQQRSAAVQDSHPLPTVDTNESDTAAEEDTSSMLERKSDATAAQNTSDDAVLSGTNNDKDPIDALEQQSNAVPTMTEQMLDSMERNIENEAYMDDNDVGNNRNTSFSFDLGYALRSGLFLHGAAAAATPAENDEEETIDSWAQTDGTVGSLDIRLEEITAEI